MNESVFKYWLIYADPSVCEEYIAGYSEKKDDKYKYLYGYTDKKEYIKKFKQERNMKLFHIEKEYLDSTEIHELYNNARNCYLKFVSGRTETDGHGSDMGKFSVIMTERETQETDILCGSVFYQKLWELTDINPKIFKKNYRKALSVINYTNGYRMKNDPDSHYSYHDDLTIDLLAGFIRIYGRLLK